MRFLFRYDIVNQGWSTRVALRWDEIPQFPNHGTRDGSLLVTQTGHEVVISGGEFGGWRKGTTPFSHSLNTKKGATK